MMDNPSEFKKFLENYLSLLETLLEKKELFGDGKYLAQLRIAERSFNFLIDRFPLAKVKEVFGHEEWNNLKNRRDKFASQVSEMIETDPNFKKRYERYCESLKNSRSFSSLL